MRILVGEEDSVYWHEFSVGDTGVVVELDLDEEDAPSISVRCSNLVQFVHPSEVELVNE